MKTIEHTQRHHQCHRSDGNTHHRDTADHIDSVGTLLREEVASGDVKWEVHTWLLAAKSLFFQQLVNAVDIVEGVVNEETQLRNHPQLVANPRS